MDNYGIAKLSEYAEFDETEVGEMLDLLIQLHRHDSCLGHDFFKALNIEMEEQLKWFQEHIEIVYREIIEKRWEKQLL